jgi:hypothetical protein
VNLTVQVSFFTVVGSRKILHVAPIKVSGFWITIPSNPVKRLITGLLEVPTVLQHCKAAGAPQSGATAAVDVTAAVDSVVDSASEDV